MNYYQVPMLSNSKLGDLDRMHNEKFKPSDEILEKAFKAGNQIDYSLFEPQNLDLEDPNLANIRKMQEQVMAHPLFKAYYNHPHCKHQHEVYRIIQGIPFKCKLDSYLKSKNLIMEFKSTACKSEQSFMQAAFGEQLNYDRQIALYMNLANVDKCIFVGVSKFNFKVFVLIVERDDKVFKQGMKKLRDALGIFQQYQQFIKLNYPLWNCLTTKNE